jgi:Tautomerase enzyme
VPHIVVKHAPGSSEEQKIQLAEEIVKDVMRILDRKEEVIPGCARRSRSQGLERQSLYTGYPGQMEHAL